MTEPVGGLAGRQNSGLAPSSVARTCHAVPFALRIGIAGDVVFVTSAAGSAANTAKDAASGWRTIGICVAVAFSETVWSRSVHPHAIRVRGAKSFTLAVVANGTLRGATRRSPVAQISVVGGRAHILSELLSFATVCALATVPNAVCGAVARLLGRVPRETLGHATVFRGPLTSRGCLGTCQRRREHRASLGTFVGGDAVRHQNNKVHALGIVLTVDRSCVLGSATNLAEASRPGARRERLTGGLRRALPARGAAHRLPAGSVQQAILVGVAGRRGQTKVFASLVAHLVERPVAGAVCKAVLLHALIDALLETNSALELAVRARFACSLKQR